MSKKKIAVLGSGGVGTVLANGFIKHGHAVMRGSRDPDKLADWRLGAGPQAHTGTFAEAARFGELIVLAVKGSGAESAVALAGDGLNGKIVIDATNPIADGPPTQGLIPYTTSLDRSLMETLQRRAPLARFVKAFSCVGAGLMVNPVLPGGPPTMFICGEDSAAKGEVTAILEVFGWEAEDLGGAVAARAIEPLAILWCIPGILKGDWMHAFKMLRP